MEIKIEKIRAEVKRLYKENTDRGSIEGIAAAAQLHKVLAYIDSLPEEQVSKDLMAAAVDYADWAIKQPKDYCINAIADYSNGITEGFVAGAKWQKTQLVKQLAAMPWDKAIKYIVEVTRESKEK